MSAANKSVVHNFQVYLSEKTSVLCSTLFSFIARQKEQLKHVEELCQSCVEFQDKVEPVTVMVILIASLPRLSYSIEHLPHGIMKFLSAVIRRTEDESVIFEDFVYFAHGGSSKYCPIAQVKHEW